MDLKPGFVFKPLPPIHQPSGFLTAAVPDPADTPLGPLQDLVGRWRGQGLNLIWRPFRDPASPQQDRFLELNLTDEQIDFAEIPGQIPNRGLLQGDINMRGLTYLQSISDRNNGAGLHMEPGIWANVPATTNPALGNTVVRMASIPHGTTVLAQGLAIPEAAGSPRIDSNDITPFAIGEPSKKVPFPESTLANPTQFRSAPADIVGITQEMIDDPNSVLISAMAGQTITRTAVLVVSSDPTAPVIGGGTDNTAFLQGSPSAGPNAQGALVTAIFWIEHVQNEGEAPFLQLQYTQTVLLNFNGLSWPHITVATLRKQ